MNIYYNKNNTEKVNVNNLDLFKGMQECKSIDIEVYDNEYYVLNFMLLSNVDAEKIDFAFDVDRLASNLDKNNLPKDVRIFTVINKDSSNKDILLTNNKYLPIYIGIDASYLADECVAHITVKGNEENVVTLNIKKNGYMIHNKGADREDTLSRLDWLNSNLFKNHKKSYIYDDVVINGNRLTFRGKDVELSREGYIKNVYSYIDDSFDMSDKVEGELLDGGIRLDIYDNVEYAPYNLTKVGSYIKINSKGEGDTTIVENECIIGYEGSFDYNIKITAKEDTIVDVEQKNDFSKYASKYMNGLGYGGGYFKAFNFKWNENYQDSIFIGNVNVGARIKWMAEDYVLPFNGDFYKYQPLNIPTTTWDNNGNGGIDVLYEKERAKIYAYSGKISMKKGEVRTFRYSVYLTPFHEVNFEKHFNTRYYQNNRINKDSKRKILSVADKHKLNMVTLHHKNDIYPYINYPFKEAEKIKDLVLDAKDRKINVKIYYNFKDISNKSKEIFPFNFMNDNILFKSDNNRVKNNISERIKNIYSDNIVISHKVNYTKGDNKGEQELGILTSNNTRYNNYYVENVNWLAKECEVKGIHISNSNIDRDTIERVRKALDRYNGDIDLAITHINNKNNKTSAMNNFTEVMPFVDSLLVGKNNYKNMTPEGILTELSGLIYGLNSDMIEGDLALGMLYGMTNRFGYNFSNNKVILKLWDKFGIDKSKMYGFWSKNALKATDDGVKITYYVNDKKVLICMFNFNNYPAIFNVDYKSLNIKGVMKSYPLTKWIMKQKFTEKTPFVLYNKCGIIIEANID